MLVGILGQFMSDPRKLLAVRELPAVPRIGETIELPSRRANDVSNEDYRIKVVDVIWLDPERVDKGDPVVRVLTRRPRWWE